MASDLCCNKCNYRTNKCSINLYNHLISVHGYACSECDFTAVFKRDLRRHIITIHQEKNYLAPNATTIQLLTITLSVCISKKNTTKSITNACTANTIHGGEPTFTSMFKKTINSYMIKL